MGHPSVRGDFESETFVQQPVVIDRAAFNQGANAQFTPNIQESETMDTLVARGPHAVGIPYRKSKRAQSAEDNETWVQDEKSNTLNNFDLGDTRTTHAVVHCADVAPTVTSSGPPYSRTGNERVETEALAVTAIPIQDSRAIEKQQGGMGVGKAGDPMYTLDTTGAQGVGQVQAFYSTESRAQLPPPDISPTLKVGSSGTCGNPPAVRVPQAYSFDSLASNSMKSSNPNSGCRPVDCAKTLDTTNPIPTKNQGGIAIVHPQAFAIREDSSNNTFHAKPVDTALCVNALQPSPQSQHAQNFVVDQKPICFKIRGGSPTETGEQGGTPGKVAGKGYLGQEDQAFTIATSQDQWLAQPVIAPTVTTCKGSKGGSSSEAIDELIAIHQAQQAIPLDSMNLLSRLGPGGENHSLQDFKPGDPMFTLTKAQHHAVAQPVFAFQQSEIRKTGNATNQELSPTLMANSKQGDNELNVVQPISCQPGFLARGHGPRPSTESFPTLTSSKSDQHPHVCAPTLTASNDPSRSPQSSEITNQVAAVQQVTMAVRRLTPVECERLQGFPDNWSRIPWKGKPEEECPDGPRYKACGNSMAVPVMHFIGSRIQLVSDVLKEVQAKAQA